MRLERLWSDSIKVFYLDLNISGHWCQMCLHRASNSEYGDMTCYGDRKMMH
jgi:hypothetical protein